MTVIKVLKKIIDLSPNYICIGLYHKYGRKPFLSHVKKLKSKFKKLKKDDFEDRMFAEYKKLDARNSDELNKMSWFRDQMLHPKETQHTLAEIAQFLRTNIRSFQLL